MEGLFKIIGRKVVRACFNFIMFIKTHNLGLQSKRGTDDPQV
jgi:hypothetical protein